MKKTFLWIAITLGFLLPAAHANRWHGLAQAFCWLLPLILLIVARREFVRRGAQLVLLAGTFVTLDTMIHFIRLREALGQPWMRLAVILCAASLIPLLAAWILENTLFVLRPSSQESDVKQERSLKELSPLGRRVQRGGSPLCPQEASTWYSLAASLLTFLGLAIVQYKVRMPMLLAERFLPGTGWLEASLLAAYAGFVTEAMLVPGRSPVVRRLIWTLFSVAFFSQLALGLVGADRFLMTGKLHLPVPALIAAGPLFRGEGLFMPILFGVTVLLVGPAWCSHLCYIGAWDSGSAGALKRPKELPTWVRRGRMALAAVVFAAAWIMGRTGMPVMTAVWLAAAFGLGGVAVMVFVSRKLGVMAHCTGWCPMGLVAGLAGRLSPWRLRIGKDCTACGTCSMACRYDALRPEDLAANRPGVSCSLCGDCLERCPRSEMRLTAFGRSGTWVRPAFVMLVCALHAVFLGVARI